MVRAGGWAALLLTAAAAAMAGLDAPHGLALHVTGDTSTSSGYVFLGAGAELAWSETSPASTRVFVDGRLQSNPIATLDNRPHLIEIAHATGVTPALVLREANRHVRVAVPASAFAPVQLSASRWRLRAVRPWVGLAAAATWTLLLMVVAWRGLIRTLPGPAFAMDRPMLVLIVVSAVAMLVGIGWGWPLQPWAPDELWPFQVLDGLTRRFGAGWFDIYPPGHFYVLSILFSPFLLLQKSGWLPLDNAARDVMLHLLSRVVSVAMALGIVTLLARFATQLGGRRYAWPAALCAVASLPFVFYARLANLDVPYLFWFCLSLLWFHASVTEPRVRNVMAFAAAGMMAILTKDQAYALYILPALWLAWRLLRSQGGLAMLAAGFATACAMFVLGHNLLLNLTGFKEHLASITGGASETYRMVPAGLTGLFALGGILASQLWWVLGVPGAVLCAAGLWFQRHRSWIPGWVWLFPGSYLLLFVAVVGYSYDRFLLPLALVLGLLGGAGLRGLLEAERRPQITRAIAVLCVAWMLWRVVSVDAVQVLESRYAVEDWLEAHVPNGAFIATPARTGYLPRLDRFQHGSIEPTATATLSAAPSYVVVNVDFMNRYEDRSQMRQWMRWLESGESPYKEVYRAKRRLAWTELAWWPTFQDRAESAFTNLDKASPEIVVYERSAAAPGR